MKDIPVVPYCNRAEALRLATPGNPVLVVYGPKACGKTTHGQKIAEYHKRNCVLDDWTKKSSTAIPEGCVILTVEVPPYNLPHPALYGAFEDFMKVIKSNEMNKQSDHDNELRKINETPQDFG